jgi:hypothetical protein
MPNGPPRPSASLAVRTEVGHFPGSVNQALARSVFFWVIPVAWHAYRFSGPSVIRSVKLTLCDAPSTSVCGCVSTRAYPRDA